MHIYVYEPTYLHNRYNILAIIKNIHIAGVYSFS